MRSRTLGFSQRERYGRYSRSDAAGRGAAGRACDGRLRAWLMTRSAPDQLHARQLEHVVGAQELRGRVVAAGGLLLEHVLGDAERGGDGELVPVRGAELQRQALARGVHDLAPDVAEGLAALVLARAGELAGLRPHEALHRAEAEQPL